MRIGIYIGETFPIYQIYKNGFEEIEIDEETLAKWKKVFEDFEKVQEEIVYQLDKQGKDNCGDRIWSGFHL